MVNIFLFEKEEVSEDGIASIEREDKVKHIIKILKYKEGSTLRAGIVGVGKGIGTITKMEKQKIELKIEINEVEVEKKSNIVLVIAIPRPSMVSKILQAAATMGVDRILFISSARIEQNYFMSMVTQEKEYRKDLIKGAEQGVTTRLPVVSFHQRPFSKFITEKLSTFYEQIDDEKALKLVAELREPKNLLYHVDQVAKKRGPSFSLDEQVFVVAVGPEGGWISEEVEQMKANGWLGFHMGEPVMRTETAFVAVCAQILMVKSSHFLFQQNQEKEEKELEGDCKGKEEK